MGTYHLRALDATRGLTRVFAYIAWSIIDWFVAPTAMDKLKRLHPKIRSISVGAFHARERFLSHLFSERKKKILFSREQDLEKHIKDGFYDSPHEIAFEDFPPPRNFKNYDLIVPLTLPDLKYLNEVRELIIDNPIAIPSMECILLCDDKYLLNRSLAANGFGHFLPKEGGMLTYPYILKKRIDLSGKNSHLISDKQQEQVFSDLSTHPEYFSQDFIKGSYEYATHILFKNQRIVHSMNIEYKFNTETPIKGKDKSIYTMICHCPYLDVFAAMLTSIGFNGLCCINYKVCDNHLFLLEINPRFGGSLGRYFFSFIRHTA
jgi:ATP-grasp domain-containing protein